MESATQSIDNPLTASLLTFVWCQAAALYPCLPFLAVCLQENHTMCAERFVPGSSVTRVTFSMMWCKYMEAQDNLANLWLQLTGHRCLHGCHHKYVASWTEFSDFLFMVQVKQELSALLDQAFITEVCKNSE